MRDEEITFDVSDEVLNRGVRLAILAIRGLRNQAANADFDRIRQESCHQILESLSKVTLLADPILQGFRDLHTAAGFSNRNFPAASESLLEGLLKNRRLPEINLLVDIYNLVSVETRLSLGAHDIAKLDGNVHLKMTTGEEGFVPLGSAKPKKVRSGGYAYIDDANDVVCFMEVKQVEKTKATLDTTDCLFIIQGNARTEDGEIQSAANRLVELTTRFCGGEVSYLFT